MFSEQEHVAIELDNDAQVLFRECRMAANFAEFDFTLSQPSTSASYSLLITLERCLVWCGLGKSHLRNENKASLQTSNVTFTRLPGIYSEVFLCDIPSTTRRQYAFRTEGFDG